MPKKEVSASSSRTRSVPPKRPGPAEPAVPTHCSTEVAGGGLVAPGTHLPPCDQNQMIDPASCEVMPGHQHPVDDVDDLAEAISIVGQIHPGQVFELPDGRRWIAAGRRRWLACSKRGFLYRADIWKCPDEDSARGEALGRVIRFIENDQRQDPSAFDLARQLRRIRNEYGLESAAEVAGHVGISTSRAKEYLSVLQASDYLLAALEKNRLSLATGLELVRMERQFGEARTRRYIKKAIAGDATAADLQRVRKVARAGVRATDAKKTQSEWTRAGNRVKSLFRRDGEAGRPPLVKLLEELQAALDAHTAQD